jgi:ABC-type transport system involved in cytochrome c biogenesis permease subunit
MYESVVWVGAGCAAFGLIFELIYRPKYYLVAAGVMSVLTLIVADMVPVISDAGTSIGPLVPVLRDNFWLTVHVLTITLSYAAFTLAWSLGHITLFKHLIHPATTAEHKSLHGFLYQVLALGVLLLAIGTILGGVWANYSWGRFWGWDPKETWALIALLTYLFVLHGRFTGLWGQFGLSVGAVVCYLSVLMAWYGVNFVLGTGLHSYGFGGGGLPAVATFCTIDLLFVGAVLLRRMQAPPPATPEAVSIDPADADGAETGGWQKEADDALPQKS